jgi:uncharacterized membrane protein YhaH (DUF805 family)
MATVASPRNVLAAWLGGAAVGCLMPAFIVCAGSLGARRFPDLEELAFFSRVFCVPLVGAAAVGAALGARRWWTAAICLVVTLELTVLAFSSIRGKEVLAALFSVINAGLTVPAAALMVRRLNKV